LARAIKIADADRPIISICPTPTEKPERLVAQGLIGAVICLANLVMAVGFPQAFAVR
jgi:hypothetical protein